METVNKSELVHRIAQRAEVSHDNALAVVNATLEEVQKAVAGGEKVLLLDFGTFEGRERAARMGRNPQTGEEIAIAAKTAAAFKAAKNFQQRVADAAAQRTA